MKDILNSKLVDLPADMKEMTVGQIVALYAGVGEVSEPVAETEEVTTVDEFAPKRGRKKKADVTEVTEIES